MKDRRSKHSFHFSPSLDLQVLSNLYHNDLAHAEVIFRVFLEETDQLINSLQALFRQGDNEAFSKFIHKISPTFYNVGLSKIVTLIQTIEAKCGYVQNLEELNTEV